MVERPEHNEKLTKPSEIQKPQIANSQFLKAEVPNKISENSDKPKNRADSAENSANKLKPEGKDELVKAAEAVGVAVLAGPAGLATWAAYDGATALGRHLATSKAMETHTQKVNEALKSGDPEQLNNALKQTEALINGFGNYVQTLQTQIETQLKKI